MPVFLCTGAAQPAIAIGAEDVCRPLLLALRAVLEVESPKSVTLSSSRLVLQAANALGNGVLMDCFPGTEECSLQERCLAGFVQESTLCN